MSPLFIPQPRTPPLPTDRSTPEGEEPDRNPEHEHTPEKKPEKKHTIPQTTAHHFSLSYTPNYDQHLNHQNSALRKYVLLAQDCVAIKFTSSRRIDPGDKYGHGIAGFRCTNSEVLDAVAVFKSFISSNKKCYWNAQLTEAVAQLEYKGYVHPSTILVTTTNRNMNVLRNAWSRRILRDPPGYTTEFLGEVEELVAQPVQQGQFAPLSDSLCWVITDITESGQEAFINSIQSKLNSTFPQISQPPRDLIFQTLEKLIREQKIYQTSRGYYVVTPDISSYINYSRSVTPAGNIYGRIYSDCYDKPSRYSTPWGSTPSMTHHESLTEELRRILTTTQSNVQLKRHNSLKIIKTRQDNYHVHNHPSMGARSLSFRLSKCNSLFDSDKETDEDEQEQIKYEDQTKPETTVQKPPSLLTRIFKFRCTSRQKPPPPPPLPPTQKQTKRPRRRPSKYNPRSASPSSSSGIYASITHRENITQKLKHRSLYDLQSENRFGKQDDGKNESSDVSH